MSKKNIYTKIDSLKQANCLTTDASSTTNQPMSPLVERAVARSGLPYEAFVRLLTQGAFRGVVAWTSIDLDRLLMASERYGLDPLSREIFMLPSNSEPTSPLLVVVGVDGWTRLINAHEQFEGLEFAESAELEQGVPAWIECTIYRRDRRVPMKLREYYCEVKGDHMFWLTHPRRMLRHKALVQCAKVAFGLAGLYEPDEAQRTRPTKLGESRFIGAQKLAEKIGAPLAP